MAEPRPPPAPPPLSPSGQPTSGTGRAAAGGVTRRASRRDPCPTLPRRRLTGGQSCRAARTRSCLWSQTYGRHKRKKLHGRVVKRARPAGLELPARSSPVSFTLPHSTPILSRDCKSSEVSVDSYMLVGTAKASGSQGSRGVRQPRHQGSQGARQPRRKAAKAAKA
eukprot:359754-Chlamydomonas_euryale.AAC.2